jgi:hypothetical protein
MACEFGAARYACDAMLVKRLHTNRATCFAVSTVGSIRLDVSTLPAPPPANDTEPPAAALPAPIRWINVANEGEFHGHGQGEFALTPAVFAELVRNLRGDPKYKPGPVEVEGRALTAGTQGVVQYDYEHASEMAPFEGSIPTGGAPAIGWVLDLEVRQGPGGKAQLWALSKLGDQIRGQIAREEYTSVSIAWNPKGIHWQTGKPIGAVLTSIAFTNHPFLRDLELIAASARMAGQPPQGGVQPGSQSSVAHADGDSSTRRVSMDLRIRLCTLYRLHEAANDEQVIRAAENAATTGANLATILQALGVQNPDAAVAALPELVAAKTKLAELQAELDSLMQADVVADEAVAQNDVGQAMAARNWRDPLAANATMTHRLSLINIEIAKLPKGGNGPKEVRAARERGRAAFFAAYGVNTNPAQQHLTQTFVAGPGMGGSHTQYLMPPAQTPMLRAPQGAPYQVTQTLPNGQQTVLQPLALPGYGQPQQGPQGAPVDLAMFSGRNVTERVMSYLASVDPKFDELAIGERIKRASAWRKQNVPEQMVA